MKTTSQQPQVSLSNFTKNKITQAQSIIGGGNIERDKVKLPGNQGEK
jgi:hypothetical protein